MLCIVLTWTFKQFNHVLRTPVVTWITSNVFNMTGHRILRAAKQTVVLLLKKSGNYCPSSIILCATLIWCYAAHSMSLQTAGHRKAESSRLPCWEGDVQPVACSSSSNSSPKLLPLVPLLLAIFHTNLLSNDAKNDRILMNDSAKLTDNTLRFLYFIKNVNSCFTGKMLLM